MPIIVTIEGVIGGILFRFRKHQIRASIEADTAAIQRGTLRYETVRNFSKSLRDELLFHSGSTEHEWSSGQTEGQVNRLKFIKRQMYGRARKCSTIPILHNVRKFQFYG